MPIARTWSAAVRLADRDRYVAYLAETGVADYRATPGNLGVLVLSRPLGELVEVVTLSVWTSMDAVRAFAGNEPEVARFYPGDETFLVEKDLHVEHHEVVEADLDAALLRPPGA